MAEPATAAPLPTVGSVRNRFTISEIVERIVKLRDRASELKKIYAQQVAPVHQMQELLENAILEHLNEQGADSIATESGTAYKTTRTSAKVEDWSAVLAFIREKEAWELLEQRIAKTAALEIVRETGASIPGVAISSETALNVRRS